MKQTCFCILAVLGILLFPFPSNALVVYQFETLARERFGNDLDGFIIGGPGQGPVINNDGLVAFSATTDDGAGPRGIFASDGGGILSIADPSAAGSPFTFADSGPAINNAGQIVFRAGTTGGPNATVLFDPGGGAPTLTTIVDDSGGSVVSDGAGRADVILTFGRPSVADDGNVLFSASLETGTQGVYLGSGGAIRPVLETTTVIDRFIGAPDISDDGEFVATKVAFSDGFPDNQGILRRELILPFALPVIDERDGLFDVGGGDPRVNNSGLAAFVATDLTQNVDGLFIGDGTAANPVTAAVDSAGAFGGFSSPSMNNGGDVVFEASLDAGQGSGIFVGPNPVVDKIIGVGDRLFNRTVRSLNVSRDAINDSGQITFVAAFENDDRDRIVRATPIQLFPDIPGPFGRVAQLTSGSGSGVSMFQTIDPFDSTDLVFDIRSLSPECVTAGAPCFLQLFVGGTEHGTFNAADFLGEFQTVRAGIPSGKALLSFVLSGPPGAVFQIDNIVLPDSGLANGNFETGYFDGWEFDTSQGGIAFVNAVAVSEPGTMALVVVGLVGAIVVLRRRRAVSSRGGPR